MDMRRPISIHAPREGCDDTPFLTAFHAFEFQSTHPVRGATRSELPKLSQALDFNPRTP